MAKFTEQLTEANLEFIQQQHMFFVATAPLSPDGRVNVSPKGLDSFRVLSPTLAGYSDMTGSGNETAAHGLENGRITFMFCAFEGKPLILRLYGKARVILRDGPEWETYAPHFPVYTGTRQIILCHINSVQGSCGYAVPFYTYVGDRDVLHKWSDNKGVEGLSEYRREKNVCSIDGIHVPVF
jgi:hypothetical protein